MNDHVRRALGVGLAVLVTLAIAILSRVPYAPTTAEEALIRLSWRTAGAYMEECRRLTQEELDRLPVHMRREEVCEVRPVPYRLALLLDGRSVIEETVQPAGARRDRPLYVFRELPVAPGEYRLEVRWEPVENGAGRARVDGEIREDAEVELEEREEEHRRLSLDAALALQAREVALITYDSDTRRLVARGARVQPSNTAQ